MEHNVRPSWQVDLKWVAGIAACVAIVFAGVLFSLTIISEQDRAEPLSTLFIGYQIDSRVTDEEFEGVQEDAAADPDSFVSLSPVDMEVKGSEIAGLTREDASLLIAGDLARLLYVEGEVAAEKLVLEPRPNAEGDPQEPVSFGPAGSLNSGAHANFKKLFAIAMMAVVGLLSLVAFLSRGFGRLGAPAVVLALTAIPLTAFWALVGQAVGSPGEDEPVYAVVARSLIRDTAADLRGFFLAVLLVSLIWIGIAVLGTVLMPLARKIDANFATPDTLATPEPLG
jgi:hypothetical protein